MADERRFQSSFIGGPFEATKFFCSFFAQRNAQGTHFVPVGLYVGVLQLAKDSYRMHRQPGPLRGIAHLATQPGALRGSHLAHIIGTLNQENIDLTSLGQRIGHAATDGTAADDDDFGAGKGAHK